MSLSSNLAHFEATLDNVLSVFSMVEIIEDEVKEMREIQTRIQDKLKRKYPDLDWQF